MRNIARMQFTGGTRIIETMQESLQGLRMVKAFSLEDEMQRRLDDSVAAVEREANKMARVSNRAGPLMETLGGFAVALAMIYGGYRGIATGAHARAIRFVPGGVPARLRAGQAAGAAQYGSQQQPGRRARALRNHRQPARRIQGRRPPAAQARNSTRSNSPTCVSPIGPARRCCAA